MKKIAAAAAGLLALSVVVGWFFYLKPGLIVEATRYGRLQWLGTGVIRFNTDKRRMPRSLDEVVRGGYLPASSPMYANPMKRNALQTPEIGYKEVEFEFAFAPESVAISIPEAVFKQGRYALVRGGWRTWTVTGDMALYDPVKDRL